MFLPLKLSRNGTMEIPELKAAYVTFAIRAEGAVWRNLIFSDGARALDKGRKSATDREGQENNGARSTEYGVEDGGMRRLSFVGEP